VEYNDCNGVQQTKTSNGIICVCGIPTTFDADVQIISPLEVCTSRPSGGSTCFEYMVVQGNSPLNPALGGTYFGYDCCSTAPPVDILDQLSDWTSTGNNEWYSVVCGRQAPYTLGAQSAYFTVTPITSTTLTPDGILATNLIDCSGCGGLVPNP
jgi:hypothetical protein